MISSGIYACFALTVGNGEKYAQFLSEKRGKNNNVCRDTVA